MLEKGDYMKAVANYHTHTKLCRHAEGTPEDYVRQAAKEGCTALGFSDHCPYPDSFTDVWPHIRMSEDQIPLYRQYVRSAAECAPFPVYCGYECEWDSNYKSWYRDGLLGEYQADYLILGSHWCTSGSSHKYCPDLTGIELNRYTDQTIDGMRSGLFRFLAHPDLFMKGYKEWDEQSSACLKAILDAAVDLNLPIEINGLGLSREPNETSRGMRYQYPYVEFWEMAAQSGVQIICSSDAHDPKDVILNNWKARDFAGRFGITPIESLKI